MKLSQPCNFTLLLFLYASDFLSFLFFSLCLSAVIFNDLLFEVFLLLLSLILDIDGTFVGLFDLTHHFESTFFLKLKLPLLLLLQLFSLAEHLMHLSFTHLLFLDTFKLTLLDLINDHQ